LTRRSGRKELAAAPPWRGYAAVAEETVHTVAGMMSRRLPPPRLRPLGRDSEAFTRLPPRYRALAERLLGGAEVFCLVQTATRIDVGSWFGPSRICACALADELLLFAADNSPLTALLGWLRRGRGPCRPGRFYAERIAMRDLRDSTYNHVTGELLLAPAPAARVRKLAMWPLEGYQLLAQIHHHSHKERRDA